MKNNRLKTVANSPRRSGTPPKEGMLFGRYLFPSLEGWPQAGVGIIQ